MIRCAVVTLLAAFVLSGCTGVQITASDASSSLQASAESLTLLGLKSLTKDDAAYQKFKADASIAQQFIQASVVPLFQGSDLNSITGATAQQALTLLNGKLSPLVRLAIQGGIDVALAMIHLPDNPTSKLSDTQRGLIVALFNGASAGLSDYVAWGGPAAPAGAKELSPVNLAWQKGGSKP